MTNQTKMCGKTGWGGRSGQVGGASSGNGNQQQMVGGTPHQLRHCCGALTLRCMHMQNAAACYHSHSLACAMQATLPEGSLLFSYVTTDDACEAYQLDRAVTTSTGERRNRLLHRLLHESRERRKVRHTFMIDAVHGKAGGATTGAATPHTQRTRLHIPIICLSSAATRSCCHCCCCCC